MKNRCFNYLLLSIIGASFATTEVHSRAAPTPDVLIHRKEVDCWLTGPLLTPDGRTFPVGKFLIQPYVSRTTNSNIYKNNWQKSSVPTTTTWSTNTYFQTGLTDYMDTTFVLPAVSNHQLNANSTHIGDIGISLSFQLLREKKWTPNVRLIFAESFPTGKYQHLDPFKLGTDESGSGAFTTTIFLTAQKTFEVFTAQFFNIRASVSGAVPSKVSVHGFNSYGGGVGANGKVQPGIEIEPAIGFELTLNKNWVLAMDFLSVIRCKDSFHGNPGITDPQFSNNSLTSRLLQPIAVSGLVPINPIPKITTPVPSVVGRPSGVNISMAPAIEYNFASGLGLLGGVWFTVAGKNNNSFVSGMISLNYVH